MNRAPTLEALVEALSRPEAWPGRSRDVEVVQTHISVVFLVGDRAYKLKKPLDFGFLDQSTLEKRTALCEAEVRLNRRYAPAVYLGTLAVVRRDGALFAHGEGEIVDRVVEMVRLPEAATLQARLRADTLDAGAVRRVGAVIARLHGSADSGERISELAGLEQVAANVRENFDQTEAHVPGLVDRAVWERVREGSERWLARLGRRLDERAAAGRDTHGDLRLEHVYLLDGEVVLVDCIEFNERFRYADPVADLAFLWMDLAVRGRRDLAAALAEGYAEVAGPEWGADLLPFYAVYRSVVRAKVAGFQWHEPEVPEAQRERALRRSTRHWLFALDLLSAPGERPCLVGVGGLPGTGKSTVSRVLASDAGFEVIRSDVVRKFRAGLPLTEHPKSDYETGLYSPAAKDAVYKACVQLAREYLVRGGRVVVDASFSKDRWRHKLLDLGRELGIEVRFLWCELPAAAAKERLAARGSDDPSDADWSVYQAAAERWEPASPEVAAVSTTVDTSGSQAQTAERGVAAVREAGF